MWCNDRCSAYDAARIADLYRRVWQWLERAIEAIQLARIVAEQIATVRALGKLSLLETGWALQSDGMDGMPEIDEQRRHDTAKMALPITAVLDRRSRKKTQAPRR